MTKVDVEEMYRSYVRIKDKLQVLKPRYTQYLSLAPGGGGNGESPVEKLAVERADLKNRLAFINKCLDKLTEDERSFVKYRYFQELDVTLVAISMNWSERGIYRIRQSVISKTIGLLSLNEISGRKNERKCS